MPTIQLYDKLLQFTLFQGLSRGDLMQIVSRTKFGFAKMPPGKRVIKEGDLCNGLYLLINGRLRISTAADDYGYTITEEVAAPAIIQPECLFGLSQRFRCTAHTVTDVNFITIDKQEVVNLTETFLVFRLNMLNIFATQTQKMQRRAMARTPRDLRERIARFFTDRCLYPSGEKTVHIYMERLAEDINDSRLNVSRALNAMQADGLVRLSRGRIIIPAIERLAGTL